jgi:hypothetical protein
MGQAPLAGLSGYGPDADVEPSRAAGGDHHLVKPVDTADTLRLSARPTDSATGLGSGPVAEAPADPLAFLVAHRRARPPPGPTNQGD